MPRIESESGTAGRWSIPYKTVALVLIMASAWGYIWYQYEKLHPNPAGADKESAAEKARRRKLGNFAPIISKLDLQGDQMHRIAALVMETTNSTELHTGILNVLTPEQRLKALAMLPEVIAARQEAKREWDNKLKRYFPSPGEYEAAREGERRMAEQQAQRKIAASQSQNAGRESTATSASK